MASVPTIFQESLLPCSWNGIVFFVLAAEVKAGQRAFTHSYPFNNTPYTEPLGRAARQYVIQGFLVGDDVNAQYQAMLAQIESNAPGQLQHPSLGSFQVVCINAECMQTTAGRYVEIKFTFVEAGNPIYPTSGVDTQAQTISSAANGQAASQSGFDASAATAGSGAETQNGGFNSGGNVTGSTTAGVGTVGTTEVPTGAINATNAEANSSLNRTTPSDTFFDLNIGGDLVPGPIQVPVEVPAGP